jgi:predicted TIM-barrel fold metal-dependent hydrolase
MTIDVATFVGGYPFRHLADPSPTGLLRQMDRTGIATAWVGHLPSVWQRDPADANAELAALLRPHGKRLRGVPTIHPALPRWEEDVRMAQEAGAPAVRAYPTVQGLDPAGSEMRSLIAAAAAAGLPLILTVRFEDVRQRHPLDVAPDLPAAAIRTLARLDPRSRLLVTHADRALLEQVHFGLTPDEAKRVLWDISWIWGPPEDHLRLLLTTVGLERFTFGTGMPLRIPDGAVAKLDLLDLPPDARGRITSGNLERWVPPSPGERLPSGSP